MVIREEEKPTYSDATIKELQELWSKEIDQMILGFKQISIYTTQADESIEYDEAVIQTALDSFAKYCQHFWD